MSDERKMISALEAATSPDREFDPSRADDALERLALERQADRLRYIDRLEAELADTEAEVENVTDWLRETQAELADWQRHGVKVTEDCETCEGSGKVCARGKPVNNERIHTIGCAPTQDCPVCGGTGKKLRDGIEPRVSWTTGVCRQMYAAPAEWLEATDE